MEFLNQFKDMAQEFSTGPFGTAIKFDTQAVLVASTGAGTYQITRARRYASGWRVFSMTAWASESDVVDVVFQARRGTPDYQVNVGTV